MSDIIIRTQFDCATIDDPPVNAVMCWRSLRDEAIDRVIYIRGGKPP